MVWTLWNYYILKGSPERGDIEVDYLVERWFDIEDLCEEQGIELSEVTDKMITEISNKGIGTEKLFSI